MLRSLLVLTAIERSGRPLGREGLHLMRMATPRPRAPWVRWAQPSIDSPASRVVRAVDIRVRVAGLQALERGVEGIRGTGAGLMGARWASWGPRSGGESRRCARDRVVRLHEGHLVPGIVPRRPGRDRGEREREQVLGNAALAHDDLAELEWEQVDRSVDAAALGRAQDAAVRCRRASRPRPAAMTGVTAVRTRLRASASWEPITARLPRVFTTRCAGAPAVENAGSSIGVG